MASITMEMSEEFLPVVKAADAHENTREHMYNQFLEHGWRTHMVLAWCIVCVMSTKLAHDAIGQR
jgi:hypothetical protein